MDNSSLNPDELGWPYGSLTEILDIGDIIALEHRVKGLQIRFAKKDVDVRQYYPALVAAVGADKTKKIARRLSGDFVYFAELKSTCRDKIHDTIRREFDGYNYKDLAVKYGYSERHIRYIVDGQRQGIKRQKDIMDGQIGLEEMFEMFNATVL